jgi:hypothetical protein
LCSRLSLANLPWAQQARHSHTTASRVDCDIKKRTRASRTDAALQCWCPRPRAPPVPPGCDEESTNRAAEEYPEWSANAHRGSTWTSSAPCRFISSMACRQINQVRARCLPPANPGGGGGSDTRDLLQQGCSYFTFPQLLVYCQHGDVPTKCTSVRRSQARGCVAQPSVRPAPMSLQLVDHHAHALSLVHRLRQGIDGHNKAFPSRVKERLDDFAEKEGAGGAPECTGWANC